MYLLSLLTAKVRPCLSLSLYIYILCQTDVLSYGDEFDCNGHSSGKLLGSKYHHHESVFFLQSLSMLCIECVFLYIFVSVSVFFAFFCF